MKKNPKHSFPLCDTVSYHIQPRAARNMNGRFLFVVNNVGGQPFVQLVLVTECLGQEMMCGQGRVDSRHRTMCKQGYSEHRLVAMEEGGRIIKDTFLFPRYCVCYSHIG